MLISALLLLTYKICTISVYTQNLRSVCALYAFNTSACVWIHLVLCSDVTRASVTGCPKACGVTLVRILLTNLLVGLCDVKVHVPLRTNHTIGALFDSGSSRTLVFNRSPSPLLYVLFSIILVFNLVSVIEYHYSCSVVWCNCILIDAI